MLGSGVGWGRCANHHAIVCWLLHPIGAWLSATHSFSRFATHSIGGLWGLWGPWGLWRLWGLFGMWGLWGLCGQWGQWGQCGLCSLRGPCGLCGVCGLRLRRLCGLQLRNALTQHGLQMGSQQAPDSRSRTFASECPRWLQTAADGRAE